LKEGLLKLTSSVQEIKENNTIIKGLVFHKMPLYTKYAIIAKQREFAPKKTA
jgi:hypothetical protein